MVSSLTDLGIFIRPKRGVQAVSIRQDDHPMPLLTQLLHDVDDLRAQGDKNGLPAVRELLVT